MTDYAPARPLDILYVLPYVPSPIRVRPFQIIRHLVQREHRITVAALGDGGPGDVAAADALRALGVVVHVVPHPKRRAALQALAALPTPTPLWAAWCASPAMHTLLRSLTSAGNVDVVHVEHLRAAHFASAVSGLPRVFDAVDCLTDLRRQLAVLPTAQPGSRLISHEEAAKLRRYEPLACRPFDRITVAALPDAEALRGLGVMAPITVVPNGVDRDAFRPAPGTPARWSLVFSGKMSYAPNEDAALFLLNGVLPCLDAILPKSAGRPTVCLAGSAPSARLRRTAARWGDRVTVTGYAEDLQPLLTASRLAVCPLRAAVGIQNKVLEAMACGLPVVATPAVARGLRHTHLAEMPSPIRIAETPDDLARGCADWLCNPNISTQAGAAARALVDAHYRWEAVAAAFEEVYSSARLAFTRGRE
jgi:glycosyltransferase involved in cell wall biosynthesis